ncbi:contact-dependent growth inhibition system immunity protein [Streptomyces sp. NPDC058279]|uniref:contact-dependent growth inhibition system immunity protein n=1 Tax=Streptomyces sp. NPDC058279 TaxID=3346418 RepID=UPI0036F0FAD7
MTRPEPSAASLRAHPNTPPSGWWWYRRPDPAPSPPECLAAPAEPSPPPPPPRCAREWRECFPGLSHLLGAYFHQDFALEYSSYDEALNDCLDDASEGDLRQLAVEIRTFLILNASDRPLERSAAMLGLGVLPPRGGRLRRWLTDVRETALRRLPG